MAIKNVNSTTINLVGSHKRKRDGSNIKCNAKQTLILADCLQTVAIESAAKKKKFQWSPDNVDSDYFDTRNFSFAHECTKKCSLKCSTDHTCPGTVYNKHRKRTHRAICRSTALKNPSQQPSANSPLGLLKSFQNIRNIEIG